jgi:Cache domain./HAMP domain.
MDKIKTETITLAKSKEVESIAGMRNFVSITKSIDNFMKLKNVEKILNQIVYGDNNIHSIYLYIAGADYVITTKSSILQLVNLRDTEWLKEYNKGAYNEIGNWTTRRIPYTLSLQLENTGYTNVITYIYPLTSLTTPARGIIAVNVYESKFANLINESMFDGNGYTFIIDENGKVVSHEDKSYFMKDLKDTELVHDILEIDGESGSIIEEDENGRNLYVYVRDPERNWIYISCHSLNVLMEKVNGIKKVSTIGLILITGFGLLFTFLIALWISKPLRKLVNTLKTMEDLSVDNGINDEITFLTKAFHQMNIQKQKLYKSLKKNEMNVEELFLNDLIKGNLSKYQESDIDKSIFPHGNFVVAMLDIDHKQDFISQYNPEQRYYYKTWILNQCKDRLREFFVVKGFIYMENSIALIINFNLYDSIKTPNTISYVLTKLQKEVRESFKISFSAGIGGCHGEYSGVRISAIEAMEALRQKLLMGSGSIIFWDKKMGVDSKYYYPYNNENEF